MLENTLILKKLNNMKFLKHLIPLAVFVLAALLYFSPVLKGEKLFQSDIQQFIGMAKEVNDFRAEQGEEPYWTNSSFVGMPTFQLSAYYPNDILKSIDGLLRFLPRPADYLFLYFLSFFLFLRALKVEHKLAILGSLAFGFSTYLIIILGVGHNAKAHAIAYMPAVLAGIIYLKDKQYLRGFLLTTLAMGLEINASHPQMTYYLLFTVLIFGLVWLIQTIKSKEWKSFYEPLIAMVVAVVLAVGMNANGLMATKEYADFSTRSASELTINPDGTAKQSTGGLSYDYITEYSYGWLESFDLIYSRFMGGGNSEPLGTDSASYEFLSSKIGGANARNFVANAPTYWGGQPIVAAPAYIGGSIFFLFLIGAFLIKGPLKNWLLASAIFSLLLSFGKNFAPLTEFFIDYIPFYDKFRAVSSIQVILELCIPTLAILGLKAFFSKDYSKEKKLDVLKKSLGILGGFSVLMAVLGPGLFNFVGGNDDYYNSMIPGFSDALMLDRKAMFRADAWKTVIYVLIIATTLYFYLKSKLSYLYTILIIGATWTYDLVSVDRRYVNDDDFVLARKVDKPFVRSEIDAQILADESYYRVANLSRNLLKDGATSYYHHSLGGYHAAKPKRFQDLYDFYLVRNHMEIYNLLNTKYFIIPGEAGEQVQMNPNANGNVWFVDKLVLLPSADDVITTLGEVNTKQIAVVQDSDFQPREIELIAFEQDSIAQIELTSYGLNKLVYQSKRSSPGFAVFSEAYYAPGWKVELDGKEVPHFRVDYMLRGMDIPAGGHEIVFRFEPPVIQQASFVVLISAGLFLVIFLAMIYRKFRS